MTTATACAPDTSDDPALWSPDSAARNLTNNPAFAGFPSWSADGLWLCFTGIPGGDEMKRCEWAGSEPLYVAYHDEEWGVPSRDDRHLFEMLILEGAQAGLSWITILRKRGNYRTAFDGFDPEKIARYGPRQIASLLQDPGIVRNRLKVEAAVKNARACLDVLEETGSFHEYLWQFVGGTPKVNRWTTLKQLPAKTAESDAMSRALKKRGFSFVGSTICYAFMQAVGMVNDHVVGCFRYGQVGLPRG